MSQHSTVGLNINEMFNVKRRVLEVKILMKSFSLQVESSESTYGQSSARRGALQLFQLRSASDTLKFILSVCPRPQRGSHVLGLVI